jgi:exodeoxyribonuclease III
MNKIKIVCWNVNGIRAVHKKGFRDWFCEYQPDILCLQETKASSEQFPADIRHIKGYHTYFSTAQKKGYSGVALYTKMKPLKVEKGLGVDEFDREGRTLIADYGDFVLINIYFPNGKMSPERLQFKMDFYGTFLEYAEQLKDEDRNLVICGDLNTAHKEIDIARPKENSKISGFLPEERAWVDNFLNHGYLDTFREFNKMPEQYSWWSYRTRARERNVGWRLDYFFVNKEFIGYVESSKILVDVIGSDHAPVELDLELDK